MNDSAPELEIIPHPYSAIITGGLRSIASSVPFLSSLSQAWSEYEDYRTAQRIQRFFDHLRRELEGLSGKIDNRSNLLREDIPELLEIAVDKVRKEFDEAKRAIYAHVLARMLVTGDTSQHAECVAVLEALNHLSELDLRVLRLFEGKLEADVEELRWRELELAGSAIDQVWIIAGCFAKLESRGLIVVISTHAGGVYIQDPYDATTLRWLKTKYRVLSLGKSLIDLLSTTVGVNRRGVPL